MRGENDQCSAYYNNGGNDLGCKNGFPVSAICMGHLTRLCGCAETEMPACQREDLGPAWVDESGKPWRLPKDKE